MAIIKFRIKSYKKEKTTNKISLSFKRRLILENISFNLNKVIWFIGPNVAGKSTIFNLITGLLKPDFGSIIIDGVNVIDYPIAMRASKFQIGFCPQYGGYFHDLTLYEFKSNCWNSNSKFKK